MGPCNRCSQHVAAVVRLVQLPPALVVAFVCLLAVGGLLHGNEAGSRYHADEPLTQHPSVDLANPSWVQAWLGHSWVSRAFLRHGWSGRTATWFRHARAMAGQPSDPSQDALPGINLGGGQYALRWGFLDAGKQVYDLSAAVDAATRWASGESSVPRIAAPEFIRFSWIMKTPHLGDPGFTGCVPRLCLAGRARPALGCVAGPFAACFGTRPLLSRSVWAGFGFGVGMAGSDLFCSRIVVNTSDFSIVRVSSPAQHTMPHGCCGASQLHAAFCCAVMGKRHRPNRNRSSKA